MQPMKYSSNKGVGSKIQSAHVKFKKKKLNLMIGPNRCDPIKKKLKLATHVNKNSIRCT